LKNNIQLKTSIPKYQIQNTKNVIEVVFSETVFRLSIIAGETSFSSPKITAGRLTKISLGITFENDFNLMNGNSSEVIEVINK